MIILATLSKDNLYNDFAYLDLNTNRVTFRNKKLSFKEAFFQHGKTLGYSEEDVAQRYSEYCRLRKAKRKI